MGAKQEKTTDDRIGCIMQPFRFTNKINYLCVESSNSLRDSSQSHIWDAQRPSSHVEFLKEQGFQASNWSKCLKKKVAIYKQQCILQMHSLHMQTHAFLIWYSI